MSPEEKLARGKVIVLDATAIRRDPPSPDSWRHAKARRPRPEAAPWVEGERSRHQLVPQLLGVGAFAGMAKRD
jgi:hypothetical protein